MELNKRDQFKMIDKNSSSDLVRKYGTSQSVLTLGRKNRIKYFDSGDYELEKYDKTISVGSLHPTPQDMMHYHKSQDELPFLAHGKSSLSLSLDCPED